MHDFILNIDNKELLIEVSDSQFRELILNKNQFQFPDITSLRWLFNWLQTELNNNQI